MKRIIIADDSVTARMFTRRCLEISGLTDGVELVDAANGVEALAALRDAPADLLVTDLNMPEMDGEQLLARVIASPKLNRVPVMVITSADSEARSEKLLAMGAKVVLRKPISPPVVAEALEKIIGAHKEEWG